MKDTLDNGAVFYLILSVPVLLWEHFGNEFFVNLALVSILWLGISLITYLLNHE